MIAFEIMLLQQMLSRRRTFVNNNMCYKHFVFRFVRRQCLVTDPGNCQCQLNMNAGMGCTSKIEILPGMRISEETRISAVREPDLTISVIRPNPNLLFLIWGRGKTSPTFVTN